MQRCATGDPADGDREGDLAEIATDQDRDGIAHGAPHGAALDHGIDQRIEARIGEHDVRGSTRSLCAVCAHGDADIGDAHGWGVVGAVAHHADHVSGALQRSHHAHLLGWRNTSKHTDTLDLGLELSLVE